MIVIIMIKIVIDKAKYKYLNQYRILCLIFKHRIHTLNQN